MRELLLNLGQPFLEALGLALRNIAGLYSLVATCEANGVNPIEYLRDVLLRIGTHPADRIDELAPITGNRQLFLSCAKASTA